MLNYPSKIELMNHLNAVTTITTIMNGNNRVIYPKYFAYHVIAFGTFHFDVNHYPYFFRHTHQPALISRLEVKRSINTLSTSVFGTPQVSPISNITLKYNDVSLFMQNRFPIQNVGFCLKTNIFQLTQALPSFMHNCMN